MSIKYCDPYETLEGNLGTKVETGETKAAEVTVTRKDISVCIDPATADAASKACAAWSTELTPPRPEI